jgi:uncharacterized protein YdaU (DUF1376 family)
MTGMNFYKRYMGDFGRDTAHLTMIQRGAYNELLDYYYSTEKALPVDPAALYRIAKAMSAAERKAVDEIASQFFPVNGDGLRHNNRADREIAKHNKQVEVNRELGKRGGRPKTESLTESVSNTEPIREPNHNPNQIPDTRYQNKSKSTSGKPDLPPGFVRFWEAWPKTERKQGKAKCAKLWKRKGLEACADAIVAHVEKMAASESWRTGFDPMPETYLNGDRWDGAELDAVGKTALGECEWNRNGNRDPDAGKCTRPAGGTKNGVAYCHSHLGLVH